MLGPGRLLATDGVLAQLERLVQRLDRRRDLAGGDHAGDLDRRGGDHLDVDPVLAQGLEDLRRDPGVAAHPRPDDRDLSDALVGLEPLADLEPLERLRRAAQIAAIDREREVGLLVGRHGLVLDDHVDVHVGVGQGAEDLPGHAWLVAHPGQGHARLVGMGHGCHRGSFHRLLLRDDEGTGALLEGAAAVHPDLVVSRVLDRAQLEHLGAGGRHLEHLLERDHPQQAGVSDQPRVGAEHPADVRVDLADVRAQRRRDRDRGRVGAAAAERGHVAAVARHALEAGDQHDPVVGERLADAVGPHVEDARLGVRGVGDDPRLRPRQRDRVVAQVVDRHRAQSAGDPLAGRQQHVHLAGRGVADTSWAMPTRSSVVLPRAESTATTRLPSSRAATIRCAARLMSSAPATEVPPNFITTISPVAGI